MEVFVTSSRGDAERAARRAVGEGFGRLVVAGGDGTVNEVVNGLAGSEVEMGIAALGTANVLARELKLPINDARAAAAVIVAGRPRRIDLGFTGSRYFAAMAGFGFDAAVVRNVVPRIKNMIGVAAYGIAIAKELVAHRPAHFTLEIDGQVVAMEASIVLIANSASYAYGIKVAAQASVDDGLLDVMIFEKARLARVALLRQAYRVLVRTHLGDPNIRHFRARRVRVEAEPAALIQVNGEEAGATPAVVEVVPGALTVIVPAVTP